MKNITLKISYMMLCVSIIIASLMFILLIDALLIIKVLFPIVFSIIMTGLFVLLTLHYIKCIKLQKKHKIIDSKSLSRIQNTNNVLAFIFGFISFTMILVGIYPLFLGGFFEPTIYFFILGALFGMYTLNLILINKKLNTLYDSKN